MGRKHSAAILAGLLSGVVSVQAAGGASETAQSEQARPEWSYCASAYFYFVTDERDYVLPTMSADRRWLHLEARYNYEDLETGSLWVGFNFSAGEELSLEFTPMFGGVFVHTTGIAPGYRGSLDWRVLELYSEGEYVVDTGEREDSFFYCWTELTVSFLDWLRAGLVGQRTQVYESDLNIQRGFLVGLSFKPVEITAYVFNPDEDQSMYVISVGVEF